MSALWGWAEGFLAVAAIVLLMLGALVGLVVIFLVLMLLALLQLTLHAISILFGERP